ncbi:Armadillo-like helical-containing protein [Dioscorea alata]|uniref:Armadillo-like helical-containing protein n=2 Tax=Dioscorea alata TaxID=55571 RepID=A0ACB7VL67_DIOAL|nr:Armadillo-like helical-containing protein [Dioscorea alata]KAH7674998.1 Armadillo-like helical-containing protein [Dioscorea alata]
MEKYLVFKINRVLSCQCDNSPMAKCARADVGALAGNGGFRLWPLFSAAVLRRKLLETMMCGISRQKRRHSPAASPAPAPVSSESKRRHGSERLAELLMAEASESGSEETEAEFKRKVEVLEELKDVVRRLQEEDHDRRRSAAMDVRRLAKDDPEARETLAMLGSIPPLVGMVDSDDPEVQIATLYALANLGIGNDMNKAAIVKAGAIHKMLTLLSSGISPSISEAIVANFLSLSALDSNKPIIGSSGAIPFLVNAFKNPHPNPSSISKQDALRALFNLSIAPTNVPNLIDAGLAESLLAAIGDMEFSDRALAILSNLVTVSDGRRAVSRTRDAFPILVDVLNWSDSPSCQEKAAYILMVMAHKGYNDRTAMIQSGVISSLLELTLLGSQLAQKRASRLLEILTVDKGKQVSEGFGSVSAPIKSTPSDPKSTAEIEVGMSEERRAVRQLVQQSLQSNMWRIVRRANLPGDFEPSDHFKALTSSSTSKSLPF